MSQKIKITYRPEGGSVRSWTIDTENPGWDVMFSTEKVTGWPWMVFAERLGNVSAIALQALLFTLRKRDEPRLELDSVRPELSEIDLEIIEPDPALPAASTESARDGDSGEA